ncbi:NlpC/P60 family protein [Rhizobium sp. TRM95111]|uniref:C40 family peptidase n=1 Tax=Rhizobium alarense TaxID=2846851 RepID=UPI001F22C5DB|nr:NlpC/P60 family protein [Rhizobium alarense]MCF3640493.1 NlpC/P60 family protein [Rhizobium alarense]
MPDNPDRRLNAYRPDLAEEALRDVVDATRYVGGTPARIAIAITPLRARPDESCGIDTELLYGEPLRVLDRADGWAWIKSELDGYVGYLPEAAIAAGDDAADHMVVAPRSFVYRDADLKTPVRFALSMGSRLRVAGEAETRGTRYLALSGGGFVVAAHCRPLDAAPEADYVAVAARLVETPYLWGGRSGFGIDCSGLVQLSMMLAGQQVPRDSDMQAAELGDPIGRDALRRGDLVFWKGHVAIMEDAHTILHANGHTMSVAREGLEQAIERIGWLYQQPTGYRRP